MLEHTSALFVNGFIFDELPGAVVLSAVSTTRKAGAATFFDPGPRAWTLGQGERKQALEAMLDASHVVLMTQAGPCSLDLMWLRGLEVWCCRSMRSMPALIQALVLQEEAQAVTGEADPEAAAAAIVQRPGSLTEWCVIKLGPQGALLRTKTPPRSIRQPAIQVSSAVRRGSSWLEPYFVATGDSPHAGASRGHRRLWRQLCSRHRPRIHPAAALRGRSGPIKRRRSCDCDSQWGRQERGLCSRRQAAFGAAGGWRSTQ